jgi:predicted GH43/DUF377 family glycosyl hydrolase
MSFITISKDVSKSGYESHLAESEDLRVWKYLYPTLRRDEKNSWDSKQIAAYAAFVENDIESEFRLQSINGEYYFAYLGGNLNGYETDPLFMGECKTKDPLDPAQYVKFENPILSPTDSDARYGETLTLYKACMFVDKAKTTGHLYVNAYNAKGEDHKESRYLSVSDDGEHWQRYGDKAIVFDDSEGQDIKINGDPQILKINDLYVMVYFILQNGKTFNTFACSYDLLHWTKWKGAPLIESEYEWEDLYAHKPWIVVKEGIVYHFYCAVNSKGERFIALATSKSIEK